VVQMELVVAVALAAAVQVELVEVAEVVVAVVAAEVAVAANNLIVIWGWAMGTNYKTEK